MATGSGTRLALLLTLVAGAAAAQSRWSTDILAETFGYGADSEADIPLAELRQGCPQRDCIPSIDAPRFVPASQARHVADDDLVLALDRAGVARAYPVFILNYHEIVNDSIAGEPIAITFCPLCGSGLAFRRVLDGREVQFGVSGLLFDSDLVMYDRGGNSLWLQISGKAVVGPARGQMLESVPLAMTTWREWRQAHPNTEVLAIGPGMGRDYGNKSPYGDYQTSASTMFPVRANDLRVHPKTVVFGVKHGDAAAAVSERLLAETGEHRQMLSGGTVLEWRREDDGTVRVAVDGGPELLPHRMFWFAWYTFHPHTEFADRPRAQATAEPEEERERRR